MFVRIDAIIRIAMLIMNLRYRFFCQSWHLNLMKLKTLISHRIMGLRDAILHGLKLLDVYFVDTVKFPQFFTRTMTIFTCEWKMKALFHCGI